MLIICDEGFSVPNEIERIDISLGDYYKKLYQRLVLTLVK